MKTLLAALVVAISSQALTVSTTSVAAAPPQAAAAEATTRFEPVSPCRLLDTRESRGLDRPVDAGSTLALTVAGTCNVSDDATALALTVTSVHATGSGFLRVFPSDADQPATSNVNFSTDSTIANGVITRVSAGASFKVFTPTATHVVIDVSGQFLPSTESNSGRFVPLTPQRALDTRRTNDRGSHPLTIALPDGVPSDAIAVALSVTIVDAAQPGHATTYAAGTDLPDTSNVNSDSADHTRSATMITPVTSAGFSVHRRSTSDLVIDVWGYMTGDSAALSSEGLYVPTNPTRIWDSRDSFDPLNPGGWTSKAVGSTTPAAVVANITAVNMIRPGWISTFPAGHPNSDVSMLNVSSREPRSSLTIVQTSADGLGIMSRSGAHLVVDTFGYFTGPAVPTGPSLESNPPNRAPHNALFISDSSIAGIRWTGNLSQLSGANFVSRLESCRRLIGQSCRGREGYAPPTALSTLASTPGSYDTLIMATGYNDGVWGFESAFDQIMRTARLRGIKQVVWLTYRTEATYVSPSARSNVTSFQSHNRVLAYKLASGRYPELQLADWNTYSTGRTSWVTPDGVHVRPPGAAAVAWYLSNKLASLDRRPCPAPTGVNTPGGWCADPDQVGYQG